MPLFRGDMKAGYLGLIAAVVAMLIILFGMVQLTNMKFEGHELPRANQPAGAGH